MDINAAIDTHLRMIDYHVKQMSNCEAIDNYELVSYEIAVVRALLLALPEAPCSKSAPEAPEA